MGTLRLALTMWMIGTGIVGQSNPTVRFQSLTGRDIELTFVKPVNGACTSPDVSAKSLRSLTPGEPELAFPAPEGLTCFLWGEEEVTWKATNWCLAKGGEIWSLTDSEKKCYSAKPVR